jgi:hypothetical protein
LECGSTVDSRTRSLPIEGTKESGGRRRLLLLLGLLIACESNVRQGAPAESIPALQGVADAGPLRVGDACRGRTLPQIEQPLFPTVSLVMPDGTARLIDPAVTDLSDFQYGTPVCLADAATPDGYFSYLCAADQHCADGYCDNALSRGERTFCRSECGSDADCGGRRCCGDSTLLTCGPTFASDRRGCHCETPADGGPAREAPSTCGRCDFSCCGSQCLNLGNDDRNCGACGHVCGADAPFCNNGTCSAPACMPGVSNADGGTCENCCGDRCCGAGEHCCAVPNQITVSMACVSEDVPCPVGCVTCMCAAPDTPIETPDGERAIDSLAVGDRVVSVERGVRVIVPIARVVRTPAPPSHVIVQVVLADGRIVEMSPGHPTADGRTFADLAPGERLGEVAIAGVQLVPYAHSYTVDILPASTSGVYFAAGAAVGSTLLAADSAGR